MPDSFTYLLQSEGTFHCWTLVGSLVEGESLILTDGVLCYTLGL